MHFRLALLESVMYEVILLPCICTWLPWYGAYHVMKTYFLFDCFTEAWFPSPVVLFFVLVREVMLFSWTSFVTFDFPVSRLTFRTSRKRDVAYV